MKSHVDFPGLLAQLQTLLEEHGPDGEYDLVDGHPQRREAKTETGELRCAVTVVERIFTVTAAGSKWSATAATLEEARALVEGRMRKDT